MKGLSYPGQWKGSLLSTEAAWPTVKPTKIKATKHLMMETDNWQRSINHNLSTLITGGMMYFLSGYKIVVTRYIPLWCQCVMNDKIHSKWRIDQANIVTKKIQHWAIRNFNKTSKKLDINDWLRFGIVFTKSGSKLKNKNVNVLTPCTERVKNILSTNR